MSQNQIREYRFDGILLKVPLYYDPSVDRYLEQFPDFEKEQIYNSYGQPLVCAVQDACGHGQCSHVEYCLDCGSCRFFHSKHPENMIGICSQPHRIRYTPPEQHTHSTIPNED